MEMEKSNTEALQEQTKDINMQEQVPKEFQYFIDENEIAIDEIDKIPQGNGINLYDLNEKVNVDFSNPNIFKPMIGDDFSRTEFVTIDSIYGTRNVMLDVPGKPQEEYEKGMWETLNRFDTEAWTSITAIKTGFDGIDKAFDGGLQSGFIVIAADSNIGKTAFISQIEWNVANNNDNVYVMSFSLDDPMTDKLSRIISIDQGIPINVAKYPKKYAKRYPFSVLKRQIGLANIRKRISYYRVYDSTFTSYAEEIEKEVEAKAAYFKANNINKKIIVFIDNFHDMELRDRPTLKDNAKWEALASYMSDMAIKYDIPVICTAELKKLNGTRRPMLDDIREAAKIKFEAKAVILCYNELHYKESAAEVFYTDPNTNLKCPIFEAHFAKNKLGPYKGRLFFRFYPAKTTMQECTPVETAGFKQKLMGQQKKSFVN